MFQRCTLNAVQVSRIRQVQEHMQRLENGASEAAIAALPTRRFLLSALPIDADEERRTVSVRSTRHG